MKLKQEIFLLLALGLCVPFLLSAVQPTSNAIVNEQLIFAEADGVVSIEAEHFYKQSNSDVRQWYITSKNDIPKVGRDEDPAHVFGAANNAYLECLPDTRVTHDDKLISGTNFSNEAGRMALLHYKVKFNQAGRYYAWVRAFSTGGEDNGIHIGIDGTWPESGQRMQWCEGKNTWKWESKQRTAAVHCGEPYKIYLDIDNPGVHDVQFSLREDGFEFDKFILTKDRNYQVTGTGPTSTIANGSLPNPFPVVSATNEDLVQVAGELKKWHKTTLTLTGPPTSEADENNPFLNYRLNVSFHHKATGKEYVIPGYYAADGNAGETSSSAGDKWKVHFAADEVGDWTYKVSFSKGHFSALTTTSKASESAAYMDGLEGMISIAPSDKSGKDLRAHGRLQYVGERYLKLADSGKYFLKVGADAPENFLSYVDFDGTFHNDGYKDDLVKNWEPHLKDWKAGDPTWKNGKGKAIIGAVNYLARKEMNVFSFLTMNVGGDDQNVFPYIDYNTWDRMDCSKLDQWEVIFEHADKLGMFLHFKLGEDENQGLLDNGGVGSNTMLYYREMIARYGHHLALNWNIGEENGEWLKHHKTFPMNTRQRLAAADYLAEVDAYDHHIVIHNGAWYDDVMGPNSKITGPSLQTNQEDFSRVHGATLKLIRDSKAAGKQWAVSVDEPGDHRHSLITDEEDPTHDIPRMNGLWGAFMAGAWGTEWYFGYQHPHSDLSCQDYGSRDLFWDQCRYVLDFFHGHNIPFWKMDSNDQIVGDGDYCLALPGDTYVVYLKKGKGFINLRNYDGEFSIEWYDPRNGGELQKGAIGMTNGGALISLENAPSEVDKDWVVVLKSIGGTHKNDSGNNSIPISH